MSEIITKDHERVKALFGSFDQMLEKLEVVLMNYKPTLNGEHFLTDVEVAERLKISRRTLQQYRSEGRVPYFKFGGKSLYRESDIQRIMEKNYCEGWE